jgi:glycosyltransferase involved in cell wall biosynthesis
MRTICIINSYNYRQFLSECIESALRQTVPFDEVVVVDDGSSDGSPALIDELAERYPNLTRLHKPNGGQLSCFNAAVGHVQDGDLVCMLDADDVYPEDYLHNLLQEVQAHRADLYFCEPRNFSSPVCPLTTSRGESAEPGFTWEISSHITRRNHTWTGNPTSCVALTGKLYRTLLPYPYESDWRSRADDVLIFGAAIIGAAKRYVPSLIIGYRVHQNNGFLGRKFSGGYHIRREMHIDRLFNHYCESQGLSRRPEGLNDRAADEVRLVPEPLRSKWSLPSDQELALWRYRGVKRTVKRALMSIKNRA